MTEAQVVITLHGIETRSEWQLDILPVFSGIQNLVHYPYTYGEFSRWRTLSESERSEAVEEFYRWFSSVRASHAGVVPSILAHSFGTYLVGRAFQMFPDFELDSLILCGSILPVEYDWDARRVRRVRNDTAGRDWIVAQFRKRWFRGLIPDSGASGIDGFSVPSLKLHQHHFEDFGHSSFFITRDHCRNHWLPFLRGTTSFKGRCEEIKRNSQDPELNLVFDQDYLAVIEDAVGRFFPDRTYSEFQLLVLLTRGEFIQLGRSGEDDPYRTAIRVVEGFQRELRRHGRLR